MTEQGAIAELTAQADQLESMLLYYEENSPGRNNGAIESYKQAVQIAISALEEIQQYRKIGTAEECREAMERQRAKKPYTQSDGRGETEIDCYECPTCDSFLGYVSDCKDENYQFDYCPNCGQAIDWSDNP